MDEKVKEVGVNQFNMNSILDSGAWLTEYHRAEVPKLFLSQKLLL